MQAGYRRNVSFPPRVLVIALAALFLFLLAVWPAFAQDAMPAATTIPRSDLIPTLNGICERSEYGDALILNYIDGAFGGQKQIFAKHAAGNLYICIEGVPGSVKARFFSVYLDPEDGREAFASSNDRAFRVEVTTGALSAYRGTGVANGWTAITVPGWDARASYTANGESGEFRIPINLANLNCGKLFGLAVYHHWVGAVGDDYGWPSNQFYDQPKTWAEVGLGGASCVTEIAITKADSADPVRVGEEFRYILTVRNNGNTTATGVEVQDPLPATLNYVGYSAPAGTTCAIGGGTVTCTIASLPVGGSVTIELRVRATAVGSVSNTASISKTSGLDPITSNNADTERTQVIAPAGKIAYVYRSDDMTANDFKGLLEANGFTVQLVPLATVLATDFTVFDLVMIADDTGSLNEWPPAVGGVSAEAAHIRAARKPVLGLGEGGYAYLGKFGKPIGWPNGWHGPQGAVRPDNVAATYWHVPNDFGAPPDPLRLYNQPVNEVGIYLAAVAGVTAFGLEPGTPDHAPLIAEQQECDQLWGFSGAPALMTADGKKLVVNAVVFGLGRQCSTPPPPPDQCIVVEKTAVPPDGTTVHVGDVITYRIKYSVVNNPACATQRAVLEDLVPAATLFVPGSATDGISPGADHVLRWNLGALAPGASGAQSFQVYVTDAICRELRQVENQARLVSTLGIATSNTVKHPVDCQPVVPDGTQPPYAEDEIQIYPYPLITGHTTDLSVRVRNLSATARTVRVTFEGSPNRFGIGIPFGALPLAGNPRVVTLPPFGIAEVKLTWIPASSGHFCIRVKIESDGFAPLYTYRNLDVTENLQPGVQDDLPFAVSNPTATTANILLVVDNTCPGWTATVTPGILINVAPGEIRTATLSVIPPTDRPLGTACHIDVQGWIGTQLIGGIRKLDVPPVHLPHANPPWEEREIVLLPDPPVLGQPGQICADIQNPLPSSRTVNLEFSVAAFGAGIGFTPVGSPLTGVILPPSSLTRHCINWTPTPVSNGSLHRCVLLRLSQAGFQDQFSQRNVDVRRIQIGSLSELLKLRIPFSLGNPDPFRKAVDVRVILIGLAQPAIRPRITPDPPPFLGPGQMQDFELSFEAVATAAAVDDQSLPRYGDVARAEVTLFLDGQPAGGFSVEIKLPSRAYLPLLAR